MSSLLFGGGGGIGDLLEICIAVVRVGGGAFCKSIGLRKGGANKKKERND